MDVVVHGEQPELKRELSLVPRDWLSAPVFSPKKQTDVREVLVRI
jgi:hypothetical protein